MPIYSLTEENRSEFPKNEFNEQLAVKIFTDYSDYIDIKFPNAVYKCYSLKPTGYIGYLPISEDTSIQIQSKVPINNVFKMLEYAYGLKSFKFLDGIVQVKEFSELYESLAMVLANRVLDRNRKGLYREYIKKDGQLPYIRGRILVAPSLRHSLRGSVNLDCEYSENTADIMDNRILAWTLYRIPRLDIKRDEVRRLVSRAYRSILGEVAVDSINPKDCINRLYNRLNEDYRPMHALCRFFLEQCGPVTDNGKHEFIPFVLYMPVLFESFVAEWLRANLPPGITLKPQHWVDLDKENKLSFRIDLVLIDTSSGDVLAVMDTKYKRSTNPTQADINQIHTYAAMMNTKNAFLIYPSNETKCLSFKIKDITIRSIIFDISKNPDVAGRLFLEELKNMI